MGERNMLNPSVALLCKLASVAGHAQEFLSEDGHEFDKAALDAALADPEVRDWLEAMRKAALAPQPRKSA